MIASVGAEIFWRTADGVTYRPDAGRHDDWAAWPREQIKQRLDGAGLKPQTVVEQRPFKLGYLVQDEESLEMARDAMDGLPHALVWSHGQYLDVLPPCVSKGSAVSHVCHALGISPEDTFVAGDSGNDREMLAAFPNSILVANWTDGLARDDALSHVYVSSRAYADGVIDGAEHLIEMADRLLIDRSLL